MKRTYSSIIMTAMLSTLLTSIAEAELRTWTDSRGNTIEAELLENMNGQVTLKKADGNETHISISNLSADDQKYVLVNSPPKIEISVSEMTDRKNQGFSFENENDSSADTDYQVQTTSSSYKVTLKKSGTIPYREPINAELYVFGYIKQDDAFVLLNKTVKKFTFNEGDTKDKFVFTSDPVTTKNLQGNRSKGTAYHGNMVVLVDHKGRVFNTKGSRARMQEFTALIRKMKSGQVVSKAELASAQNEAM
ncbi:SHD1 domain-containing protein [Pontiellaceae bacterium B12227]|nr:SHD1 domain-containing protein [Pontiellaceae bacterium B12227]